VKQPVEQALVSIVQAATPSLEKVPAQVSRGARGDGRSRRESVVADFASTVGAGASNAELLHRRSGPVYEPSFFTATRKLVEHRPRAFGLFLLGLVLSAGACALSLAFHGAWLLPFQFGIYTGSGGMILLSLLAGGDLLHGEALFRWKDGARGVCRRPVIRLVLVTLAVHAAILCMFITYGRVSEFFWCLGVAVYTWSMISLRVWFDWRSAAEL
jgi:hypothetical protein